MISVCIASYNGERYIKEQLSSILKQLGKEDELIVSDDASTDKTANLIQDLNDERIKLIIGPRRGPVKNFENALLHSKGDFIFLSDQDDVWLDGKVSTMMDALEDCDLVLSDCKIVNTRLKITNPSYFSILPPKTGVLNNLIRNHYLGCCLAFNRKVLDFSLPFPKNIVMHDIWLGLCANTIGKVKIVKEPLMLYRRHDKAVSFAAGVSENTLGYKIMYRCQIFFSLIRRFVERRIINKK